MWHLHRRRGRRIWELVNGRTRVSTGTTRRLLAAKLLEQHFLRGKGLQVNSHEPISKHAEEYIRNCIRFNKRSTIDDKQRTLKLFIAHAGNTSSLLAGCSGRLVSTFLESRSNTRKHAPISAERWNTERQILSNFFKWCQKEGFLNYNPAEGVQKKRVVQSKIPKALSREDEILLLDWLRKHDKELARMAVFVGNTGVRVRELANLQKRDVEASFIAIRGNEDWTPKDYEERAIPKTPIVEKVIREQLKGSLSKWVFCKQNGERYGRGLDLRMVRAFKRTGLGSGGFHRLRHTFATRYMEAGGDIETLRRIMGHSDTKTLTKYAHVSQEHIKKQAGLVKFGMTKV